MILGKEVTITVSHFMEHMVQETPKGSHLIKPCDVGESAPFLEQLGYSEVTDDGTCQTWRRVVVK